MKGDLDMAKKRILKKQAASAKEATVEQTVTKAEVQTALFIQHSGNEVKTDEIVHRVNSEWEHLGHDVKDLKNMDLYIKPEEDKVFYVLNGDVTGSISLFEGEEK